LTERIAPHRDCPALFPIRLKYVNEYILSDVAFQHIGTERPEGAGAKNDSRIFLNTHIPVYSAEGRNLLVKPLPGELGGKDDEGN